MTMKERLHLLVDTLPEREEQTAARVLEALSVATDPVRHALDTAPPDDLPSEADDLDGGLTEARAEMAAGRGIPHEEVKRMFGLG